MKNQSGAHYKPSSGEAENVGHLLEYVAPSVTEDDLMAWPVDAFAVSAFVLQKTGAYLEVVRCGYWPPRIPAKVRLLTLRFYQAEGTTIHTLSWPDFIHAVGWAWRYKIEEAATPESTALLKNTVQPWIRTALGKRSTKSAKLASVRPLVHCWIQLLSAADESCSGVGFTPRKSKSIETQAFLKLLESDHTTLCSKVIRPTIAGVLPKVHTPQTGITLRSLSHYLAFYRTAEVKPHWHTLISSTYSTSTLSQDGKSSYRELVRQQSSINILVVPWPNSILPSQFKPAKWSLSKTSSDIFGFFEFDPLQSRGSLKKYRDSLAELYRHATATVGRVDGIVLPELALHGETTAQSLANQFLKQNPNGFFVSGVGTSGPLNAAGTVRKPGKNRACWGFTGLGQPALQWQAKHHRWQLDRRQIENFGLGGTLNPSIRWWEHIELSSRTLTFMPFAPWFTAAVLVCEDLARQEPITELIRAVGPNLVIALLMDGPQKANRWPGRYATSLADDPGCSVLTVTSLGMAELSRPPGFEAERTIALWKDAVGGVREIKLPPDCSATVLSLSHTLTREWTADGRDDGEISNYLTLSGVHPI